MVNDLNRNQLKCRPVITLRGDATRLHGKDGYVLKKRVSQGIKGRILEPLLGAEVDRLGQIVEAHPVISYNHQYNIV